MTATSKNTALIVDSACDLPVELIEERGIFVLPIEFEVKGKQFRDRRVPGMATAFNEQEDLDPNEITRTQPTSTDTIQNFIIDNVLEEFEYAIILCISSTRSGIYANAAEALKSLPLIVTVDSVTPNKLQTAIAIDTRAVFSGEALLANYASNLLKLSSEHGGIEFSELVDLIKAQIPILHTYVVPNDLAYLKNRGRLRNEKSVGTVDYLVGRILGLRPVIHWERATSKKEKVCRSFNSAFTEICRTACNAIDQGLGTRTIAVSYSGDTEAFSLTKAYLELEKHAESNSVEIILSRMSITASIYMGPNAVSLSFTTSSE
ncbi:MAG: DegV family protein [Acidiferrobacterales bacterium]|nr:DegV family protein [Acidiferrobacterales bacterium]